MKKHIVWTLIVTGISISIFGLYYLPKINSQLKNNQSLEDESRPIAGTSEKKEDGSPEEVKLWKARGWRDENGHIPRSAISGIIKQRDEYLEKQKKNEKPPKESTGMNQISGESLGVANTNWVSRGPQNVGGRVNAIVVHPTNPNILWAGTGGGGIWKSTDGGTTWFAMNGNLQNFTIGSMAIDPNNPDTLYAGTDHGLPDGGIFKTTDGGMTWRRLEGAAPGPNENIENWSAVYRISIAPNNSNIILVATKGGLMRSTTAGEGNRSSWTNVVPTADLSLDVVFDPNNSNKAVAEVSAGNINHRVVYSTDGGVTWTNAMLGSSVLTANDQSIKLAYAKSQSDYVYAVYNKPGGGINVALSTTGGQSFTTKIADGG